MLEPGSLGEGEGQPQRCSGVEPGLGPHCTPSHSPAHQGAGRDGQAPNQQDGNLCQDHLLPGTANPIDLLGSSPPIVSGPSAGLLVGRIWSTQPSFPDHSSPNLFFGGIVKPLWAKKAPSPPAPSLAGFEPQVLQSPGRYSIHWAKPARPLNVFKNSLNF